MSIAGIQLIVHSCKALIYNVVIKLKMILKFDSYFSVDNMKVGDALDAALKTDDSPLR